MKELLIYLVLFVGILTLITGCNLFISAGIG